MYTIAQKPTKQENYNHYMNCPLSIIVYAANEGKEKYLRRE